MKQHAVSIKIMELLSTPRLASRTHSARLLPTVLSNRIWTANLPTSQPNGSMRTIFLVPVLDQDMRRSQ